MAGNQLWDRDYNSSATSAIFSPGASLVPTNVQLSPRSQAFVAENNDILLKRKGDRFLRRSRSKSWSRSPSPHGRSSYKNGSRRFSPRKRSLSNSSGESPSGRKYSRKNPKHSPKSSQEDQKKDTQPKRRGGSPISFNVDGKKENHSKEPAAQKITLNRNRIIQLNSSKNNANCNNSRPAWNRNTNNRRDQPSNSNVFKTREDDKVEKREEKPQPVVESKSSESTPGVPPVEPKRPPPVVKPPRVKTAEELLEDELLRSDDELDDGLVLTNDDDLDIDDLFESDSESENEGRFKSKTSSSKDSLLSFSKLAEKSVTKIRPLDDVIDKGGNRSRGYDKGSRICNSISRKSTMNDKKSEKKPLEFRKLSLDRKKSYGEFFIGVEWSWLADKMF